MRLDQKINQQCLSWGVLGPLAIAIWYESPTVAAAQAAASMLLELAERENSMFSLAVLTANTSPPDGHVREILAESARRVDGKVLAWATVIEGQGFRAAATRAVLGSLGLIVRSNQRHKTTSTVDDAATYLATQSDNRLRSSAIVQAAADLRATHQST
jgi:hypothetical protein